MSTWAPIEARVSDARRRLAEARTSAAAAAYAPPATLALLEALGRAIAVGAPVHDVELGGDSPFPVTALRAALAPDALDLAVLEDAATAIAAVVSDPSERESTFALQAVNTGFESRDRLEHVLLGAERVTGTPLVLAREQQMFVVGFDVLVRPLLARLTTWNELRGETAAAVAPKLRHRFWWWCEGASIAPAAVANLRAVAELVARFPEARAELEAMVTLARALASVPPLRENAAPAPITEPRRVTSLASWLDERRRGLRSDNTLRVAAASAEERVVLASTAEYEVSWRAPSSVIVDLHVDPPEGSTPHARLPSGRAVPSSLVARTVHRHLIALDAEALAEAGVVIVLPMPGGDVELALPTAAE